MSDFWASDGTVTAEIVQYIEKNRYVIDLVIKAAEIPKCDWGYDYSKGMDLRIPHSSRLHDICFLLRAETKWLANQCRFKTALDRCIIQRKIAIHACEGRMLRDLFSGYTINTRANRIIQDILSLMPPDVNELEQLKIRLDQTQAKFPSLVSRLRQEAQNNAASIHKDKINWLVDLLENSLMSHDLEPMLKRIREGDETFFTKNREYYLNCWSTSIGIIESGLPYTEVCERLEELSRKWSKESEDNPDATVTLLWSPYSLASYRAVTEKQTQINALKTSIDLYIAKAKTGKLPDALPAESAPDLFSGKPFIYERTEAGFILSCRVKEFSDSKKGVQKYEFKIK